MITPAMSLDFSEAPNLVRIIVPFAKALLQTQKREDDYEVVKRRFGLEGNRIYTLQEIGDYYNITREGVRVREGRAIKRIYEGLAGILLIPELQIPEIIRKETRKLNRVVTANRPIIPEQEIVAILQKRYSCKFSARDLRAMRFLLRVFDFDKLPDVTSPQRIALLPSWITARGFDKPAFYEKVNAVYRVLESAVVPIPLFDLKIGIKRRTKKNYSIEDIRLAAGICAAIEVLDGELYQVRIEYLSPVSNKAYRILYEAAQPKHLRDILREVNHRITQARTSAKVSYRSLGLHDDPRFAPVGRSGYWGLSEWENLQTSRIVDIMKEFFYFKKSSATANEICNYVLAKRPDVAEKSIWAYLSISKDIFTRVSEKEYELTEWGNKPYTSSRIGKPKTQRKNPLLEVVQATIESYLGQQPDNKAPLIKIIKHIVKTTNCKSPAAYNYLGKMPNLRKEKTKDGIYCFLIPKSVTTKPVANSEQQLLTMLKHGESETVELKTAACWNSHARAKDDKMIQNVVETVAAFLNSKKGGTLVIGVMDNGSIIGLVDDYKAADKSKPNRDGYELFLRNSINNNLGGDCLTFYEIRFETLNGVEVCCVAIKPSPKPVYYQGNFLVRNGNQSKKLNPQETVEFLKQRNT